MSEERVTADGEVVGDFRAEVHALRRKVALCRGHEHQCREDLKEARKASTKAVQELL